MISGQNNLSERVTEVHSQNQCTTIKWPAPPNSFVKINFDGSVTSNSAACGFIIRDDNGRPVFVTSCRIENASVSIAEAMALRDSLIKAKEKDFTNVEVEGDSKLVIDAVNGRLEPLWRLIKLVQHIRTSFHIDDVWTDICVS
ncbi:hypothetical protein ACLB2K_039949 [Fragaria x ananassa]